MRIKISLALALLICACGPAVEQPVVQQTISNDVHAKIMDMFSEYRSESGVKVLAGCVSWKDPKHTKVSSASWYYYPNTGDYRTRPIDIIRTSAVGDCESLKNGNNPDCQCQIIDVNDRNALVVPTSITTAPQYVTYVRRGR